VKCRSKITANVLGLGEVGGLEVQMFKLALMLIEVQMLNLALMPPFCQTPVMSCDFFFLVFSIFNQIPNWLKW
jgi:hypothetical protein